MCVRKLWTNVREFACIAYSHQSNTWWRIRPNKWYGFACFITTMFHVFTATQTICNICQEVFTTNTALQTHEKVGHMMNQRLIFCRFTILHSNTNVFAVVLTTILKLRQSCRLIPQSYTISRCLLVNCDQKIMKNKIEFSEIVCVHLRMSIIVYDSSGIGNTQRVHA